MNTDELLHYTVPATIEYHIGKLVVNDGYCTKHDPNFTPIITSSVSEAQKMLLGLPKECFVSKIINPDWSKKKLKPTPKSGNL